MSVDVAYQQSRQVWKLLREGRIGSIEHYCGCRDHEQESQNRLAQDPPVANNARTYTFTKMVLASRQFYPWTSVHVLHLPMVQSCCAADKHVHKLTMNQLAMNQPSAAWFQVNVEQD